MQLTNDYVIIAKDVTTDATDNMVSLLKIVDNFEIGVEPAMFSQMNTGDGKVFSAPAQFAIASAFSAEKKATRDYSFELNVELLSPEGKSLWQFKQEFALNKNSDKARININVQGLPVSGSGQYTIKVNALDKNKVIASGQASLNVVISEVTQQGLGIVR